MAGVGYALIADGDRRHAEVRVDSRGDPDALVVGRAATRPMKLMAPFVGAIGRRHERGIWGSLKRLLESGGERP
jgi:hypothetical protein